MRPDDATGAGLERYEAATARPLLVVSLAVVPVYVAQALAGTAEPWVQDVLRGARFTIQAGLGVDIAIRTTLAPRRLRYLGTHKLDVAAVIVPPLRAGREVLALRSIMRRPGFAAFLGFGTLVAVGCALVVYAAEHDREGATIHTVGDALWWAAVTTTTVGYGDEVPVTDQGRAMAAILMVLGVVVLAVVTAHIAAYFVRDGAPQEHDGELVRRLAEMERSLLAIERSLAQNGLPPHVAPSPTTDSTSTTGDPR